MKKLSDRVENIVGKEEIARFEQFLLFPQCFKSCLLMCQNEYIWNKGSNENMSNLRNNNFWHNMEKEMKGLFSILTPYQATKFKSSPNSNHLRTTK